MTLIGYARISTAEGRQVLHRQLDALNAAGCDRIFRGSRFERRTQEAQPRRVPRLPAVGRCPRRPGPRPPRAACRRAHRSRRRARRAWRRFSRVELADGHHDAGWSRLSADSGGLCGDGAKRHPPTGTRRAEGSPGTRPEGWAAPCHDAGEAPLRPEPDGRPDALHSRDLSGAGRNSAGTLYHYLYADGTFKDPGRKLLEA